MKTVKFYYSKPVHVRLVPMATGAQGEPLFYYPDSSMSSIVKVLPRITVASVYDSKENTMSFGIASCSPKDTFKKEVGRKLAEDRARINPTLKICKIKRNRIREVSKKYANDLISSYLYKDVQFDI